MSFVVNLLILLPARVGSFFAPIAPLIMRIVVGYVFMLTGWAKLNNLPQMTENFTEWGVPFPSILTPLFTRIPAVMLAFVMVVAIKVAKWGDVDSLETFLGFEEVTYMAAFLWLAAVGPGPISLDWLLLKVSGRSKGSA
jgi:putative oxidoreductase